MTMTIKQAILRVKALKQNRKIIVLPMTIPMTIVQCSINASIDCQLNVML
jgi:hypothetical protein